MMNQEKNPLLSSISTEVHSQSSECRAQVPGIQTQQDQTFDADRNVSVNRNDQGLRAIFSNDKVVDFNNVDAQALSEFQKQQQFEIFRNQIQSNNDMLRFFPQNASQPDQCMQMPQLKVDQSGVVLNRMNVPFYINSNMDMNTQMQRPPNNNQMLFQCIGKNQQQDGIMYVRLPVQNQPQSSVGHPVALEPQNGEKTESPHDAITAGQLAQSGITFAADPQHVPSPTVQTVLKSSVSVSPSSPHQSLSAPTPVSYPMQQPSTARSVPDLNPIPQPTSVPIQYIVQPSLSQQNQVVYQIKTESGDIASVVGSSPTILQQLPSSALGGCSAAMNNPATVMSQYNQASLSNAIQQELIAVQGRIQLVMSQLSQIQNAVTSASASQDPQSKQLVGYLMPRWQQLKAIYCQLLAQQQSLQRSLIAPNSNLASHMVNQNSIAMLQQQMMLQGQMHGVMQPNTPQVINPNMVRPNVVQSPFIMRGSQPGHMPNIMNSQMMGGIPGLNRFVVPPRPLGISQTGFGPSGLPPRPFTNQNLESSKSRRSAARQSKRRRKYSSESEEDEITSSDAEISSQLINDGVQIEEMELRRSSRKHVAKSYIQELPDDSEGEEEKSKKEADSNPGSAQDLIPFHPSEQIEGKIIIIEKILSDRVRDPEEGDDEQSIEDGKVEEFYVKYKCFSYLHCDWCTLSDLKKKDRNATSKVKRYKMKKNETPLLYIDEDPFNPDYIEVDRVLDTKKTQDPNNSGVEVNCYLVKWCSLPYDESTWEFEECVDEAKIKEYYEREKLPPIELAQFKPRPMSSSMWREIVETPVYKNSNSLRGYQLEGINWLLYEYYSAVNCILADEMGLGKTIQSITFLVEVRKYGIRGPFLIIAPLSTIANWYREFQNWSDFNVVVFHGSSSSRNIIHRYELYYHSPDGSAVPHLFKFEALITTYEMILADNKFLSSVNWRIAIVDEAHRLKNRNCKLLESLSNISIEHRILLTGTPLQNTLDELFSLLNFLDPQRVAVLEQALKQLGRVESDLQVQQIQSFLKPIILRRLKEDVEKNIAPKEETIIEVEMTTIQKKVYRGILERNLSFLMKGTSTSNLPNLMNIMMELRKCCNHPFLINGVEDKIVAEYQAANPSLDRGSMLKRALVESSGKLVLVDKLLPKLRDSGHKMLVFSQMVRVLDIIEDYLVSRNFLYERIDGSVRGNLRQAAIDRFSRPDSDKSVFLLCTKAGGLGINLTAADTVIIFDSDWNPQNDIQAQARCHRIGQNKAVKVYRLICRQTYEREMFDRASLKLGLDKAVLQNINQTGVDGRPLDPSRPQLSKKDVEELLKRGAYAAVMDEDVDASARFCSEDIDQILERRATVIQIVGEAKSSTFAKASFNAESTSSQIDIDDPDFWKKWAQSAKVGTTNKADFVDDTPRIRKPVRRFEDDPDVEFSSLESDVSRRGFSRPAYTPRCSWLRSEVCKVEKNLLIYGWGRWGNILTGATFKTHMTTYDVEQISKTILVFCWHHCKSDSSFLEFVEKAIRFTTFKSRHDDVDSEDYNYRPYGKRSSARRRGDTRARNNTKADKVKHCLIQVSSDWRTVDYNTLILDSNYKKHLQHYASKILIRLRLLFIVDAYLLKDSKDDIIANCDIESIAMPIRQSSSIGPGPAPWWDESCDKSLIVGTYKHGYERYSLMMEDHQLCFSRHAKSIEMRQSSESNDASSSKRRGRRRKTKIAVMSDSEEVCASFNASDVKSANVEDSLMSKAHACVDPASILKGDEWPSQTDCNTRLRRLVMAYWKARARPGATAKQKAKHAADSSLVSSKWSRKDENEFYKVVSAFGLEVNTNGEYVWDNFRKRTPFEKKDDAALSTYADSLLARIDMVLAQYKEAVDGGNGVFHPSDGFLTLEKAEKIKRRVELFDRLRKSISHPEFDNIQQAPRDNEFPDWWQPIHDAHLLLGVSAYGLDNNDKEIFLDPSLEFEKVVRSSHNSYLNSPEPVSGIGDVPNFADMSVDMLRAMVRWPKIRLIIRRINGLCSLVHGNKWKDGLLNEPVYRSHTNHGKRTAAAKLQAQSTPAPPPADAECQQQADEIHADCNDPSQDDQETETLHSQDADAATHISEFECTPNNPTVTQQ